MSPRKICAISMRPTGNYKGGHYCMSLKIGCLLNRKKSTPLPMPSEVIDHLHIIAHRAPDNGPPDNEINHRIAHRAPVGIIFADGNNVAFPDISDDDEVVDVSDSDSDNSYNDDDPYEAAYPEAAEPEDSVDIIGV